MQALVAIVTVGIVASTIMVPGADACPALLFNSGLAPRLRGTRKGLRLFTKDATSGNFQAVRIGVDPLDPDGHLVFPLEANYFQRDLEPLDFMTLRVEDFGERLAPKRDKLPCRGAYVYELTDRQSNRYAYLTDCGTQGTTTNFPELVKFAPEQHVLESSVYRYRFNPANYMQFESISFHNSAQSTWETIAERSRLMIRADVKKFFTMTFDEKEIESHLEASRGGPIGDLARLSFFLRILFFKIKMSLSTDVGFYEDSSHIPMQVNLPVNAYSYLNPGSGIVYSWVLAGSAQGAPRRLSMPRLDPGLVEKGWQELAKVGLKSCVADVCTYKYTVEIGGRVLSMDLVLERKLVERGFFPLYIEDASKVKEAMKWEMEIPAGEARTGMYFEVSGLQEGGHPWDFWLRLGSGQTAESSCPAPMFFEEIGKKVL